MKGQHEDDARSWIVIFWALVVAVLIPIVGWMVLKVANGPNLPPFD
ncbi:MAG: hypothetical protein ACAH95_07355 [Fimbriimonas sp.]